VAPARGGAEPGVRHSDKKARHEAGNFSGAEVLLMKRLACTLVALALGAACAACGPTKPGEMPPLAPRPDPGGPVAPSPIPGVPDPDKSPLPGPSPEPTTPVGEAPPKNQPVDRQSKGPEPISYEFRAAGAGAAGPIDPLARGNQQPPTDAGMPGDGSELPPIPDGSVPHDGRAEPVSQ
jgi:hypothetical protein